MDQPGNNYSHKVLLIVGIIFSVLLVSGGIVLAIVLSVHSSSHHSPPPTPLAGHSSSHHSPPPTPLADFQNRNANPLQPFTICNWTDTSEANKIISEMKIPKDCGGYSNAISLYPQNQMLPEEWPAYAEWQRNNGPTPVKVLRRSCPTGHLCTPAGCSIPCKTDDDCGSITGDSKVPFKCGYHEADPDTKFCYPSESSDCSVYDPHGVKKGYGFVKGAEYDTNSLFAIDEPACIINPDADVDFNSDKHDHAVMFRKACVFQNRNATSV